MALIATHKEQKFGIGDKIRVLQKIKEGEKQRSSVFEGIVIAIKNAGVNKTFTVRKIGYQGIGIEKIFPLFSPLIEEIQLVKKGTEAVRHAKLYFIRDKSRKEIEEIYSKAAKKINKRTLRV